MSDLTAKFDALEGQLAAQAATTGAYIDEVEDKLDNIYTMLDTINNNGATNTRYLLDALSRSDPCSTCPPPSIFPVPIEGSITPPDDTTCKKGQAFIAYMQSAMTMLDLVSGLGTGTFWSLLASAYQEVIDSSANYTGVPLISFGEGMSLIGSLINYGILNIGRGDTLAAQFASVSSGLLPVFFAVSSAPEAKAAYISYMSSSGLPSDEIDVMTKAGYDGLFNWFFSPEGTPDLSSYSGGVCGGGLVDITACTDIPGVKLFNEDCFRWFLMQPPISSGTTETIGDFFGFSFEIVDGTTGQPVSIVYRPAGGGTRAFFTNLFLDNPAATISVHTSTIDLYTNCEDVGGRSYTVRVCPPS